MGLTDYPNKHTEKEKARASDLMALLPDDSRGAVLDIGAGDGWLSLMLAERFDKVTVLDLKKPSIEHPRIQCVKGDATNLDFGKDEFDLVFCVEVIEHIPPKQLIKACFELERVAKKYILIGVPFRQDIRVGRTKCSTCGKRNPPWGHVNSFDEHRLKQLFSLCDAQEISFVGEDKECTNALSEFLMDFAGNPYGAYDQEELCIHCGAKLKEPPQRNILQKIATKLAFYIKNIQQPFYRPHSIWIHILFEKRKA